MRGIVKRHRKENCQSSYREARDGKGAFFFAYNLSSFCAYGLDTAKQHKVRRVDKGQKYKLNLNCRKKSRDSGACQVHAANYTPKLKRGSLIEAIPIKVESGQHQRLHFPVTWFIVDENPMRATCQCGGEAVMRWD